MLQNYTIPERHVIFSGSNNYRAKQKKKFNAWFHENQKWQKLILHRINKRKKKNTKK
jgi:hypothetical protein